MSNVKGEHDIYLRIFDFIVLVLKFIDKLPKTYSNQVIIGQITRSATSMGANSEEADGTSTRKDFIHCFTMVRKEGKESIYWLKLAQKLNSSVSTETEPIIQEGSEIVAIVSTIIKNTLDSSNPHQ